MRREKEKGERLWRMVESETMGMDEERERKKGEGLCR